MIDRAMEPCWKGTPEPNERLSAGGGTAVSRDKGARKAAVTTTKVDIKAKAVYTVGLEACNGCDRLISQSGFGARRWRFNRPVGPQRSCLLMVVSGSVFLSPKGVAIGAEEKRQDRNRKGGRAGLVERVRLRGEMMDVSNQKTNENVR